MSDTNTELFISSKDFDINKLSSTLCNHGVNSNISTQISTVTDKKTKETNQENGAKVEIFDIAEENLFNLYDGLIDNMGINCLWINRGDFHNCITKMSGYAKHCKEHGKQAKTCSEYDI